LGVPLYFFAYFCIFMQLAVVEIHKIVLIRIGYNKENNDYKIENNF